MLIILAVGFQEYNVNGFMNVTQSGVAAEVAGVIGTLVVNLCNWELSQPS